jgi:hypothetical protein
MSRRNSMVAAALLVGSAVFAGCSDANTTPVGVQSVSLAIVSGAEHGGIPRFTSMTQEIWHAPNPRDYAGDPDGTGTALITVNRGQGEICWELAVSDIDLPVSSAHIHRAAPFAQGPIVVNLDAPALNNGAWSVCKSVDALPAGFLDELLDSPELFYVNAHNSIYPSGAVRGQLGR